MATTLYLLESTANGIGSFRDLSTTAGSSATTGVVNTASSGMNIQWTKTAGGSLLEWISGRSPVGGWTLAGSVTFAIDALESATNANCVGKARLYKRTAGGTETEIGSSWSSTTEFGTTVAEFSWSATPPSTSFAEDDRLIIRYLIAGTAPGLMGGGRTATIQYAGAAGSSSDSRITLTEDVVFKAEGASGTTADSSGSIGNIAGTSSGAVAVAGASSGALGDFTGTAAGSASSSISGDSAGTFGAFTGSSTGSLAISAGSSVDVGPFVGNSAGTVGSGAVSSASIGDFTGSAAGSVAISGASTGAIGNFTGTAAGGSTAATSGDSAAALGDFTGAASATVAVAGSSSASLGNITGSAAGAVSIAGGSVGTIPAFTGTAAGSNGSAGTLAVLVGSVKSLDPARTARSLDPARTVTSLDSIRTVRYLQ